MNAVRSGGRIAVAREYGLKRVGRWSVRSLGADVVVWDDEDGWVQTISSEIDDSRGTPVVIWRCRRLSDGDTAFFVRVRRSSGWPSVTAYITTR